MSSDYQFWPEVGNKAHIALTSMADHDSSSLRKLRQERIGDATICGLLVTDAEKECSLYFEGLARNLVATRNVIDTQWVIVSGKVVVMVSLGY